MPEPGVKSTLEHLQENPQHALGRRRREAAQLLDEPRLVNGPDLIQHNVPLHPLKRAGHPRRIVAPLGRHGRDQDRSQVLVHLIRRDDRARTRLFDFAPERGIEGDQENIEPV